MSLMRFQRRAMTLRQRLMLTIGLILLVFQLISTFWLWHESTEQIQLFEQALRDNRNNDRHIMHEIREAVASLIVPGVFMVSLTLLICYRAVRRITRPLAELQKSWKRGRRIIWRRSPFTAPRLRLSPSSRRSINWLRV